MNPYKTLNPSETVEGNKLIAEFMGKVNTWRNGVDGYYAYHKSWDWLMPVVEKIEKHHTVNIEDTACTVRRQGSEYETIADGEGETKIEAVWQAVLQFIKWYNTQTPTQP